MSDHLSECVDAMIPDFHNERWVCICAALRTCEQRVLDAIDLPAANVQYQKVGYKFGYAAGLDAARKAVAGLRTYGDHGEVIPPDEEAAVIYVTDALAAIDALKEKP